MSLSAHDRILQFIPMLSINEKIDLLSTTSVMIPRLNIDRYEWWNEALHGVGYSPGVIYSHTNDTAAHQYTQYTTVFPQVLALSHTFNTSLITQIGTVISNEARAFSNLHHSGLHYFTPNINTVRSVLWGRAQETFGEDIYTAKQYTTAMVHALQGENTEYIKVGSTCKHYAGYDFEQADTIDRLHYNANISTLDMIESYLPVFKSCVVGGHAIAVMCSYNSINGIPSCANTMLLQNILRDEWNFSGYVVSDCAAIDAIYDSHHYTDSPEQAVADALLAGTDLDCDGQFYTQHMYDTYQLNLIDESDIDLSVTRILHALLRVGYFDDPQAQYWRQIDPASHVNTLQHKQLSYEAAQQSIVLIKNDKFILPIQSHSIQSIGLIGPLIDATDIQLGNYNGRAECVISIQQAIQNRYSNIKLHTAYGCDTTLINPHNTFDDVINVVKQSDVVLMVVGYGQDVSSETVDRTSILLPGDQMRMIDIVKHSTDSPIVLVLMCGGNIDLSMYKYDTQIQSILYVQYLGQSGGDAVIDVLFDAQYNPSGRLTTTWYDEVYIQNTSVFDMSFHSSSKIPHSKYFSYGRTYKYYYDSERNTNGVYPFGYGLSYTKFQYQLPPHSLDISFDNDMLSNLHRNYNPVVYSFNVTIKNIGAYSGGHSVLMFVSENRDECTKQQIDCPYKQLFAYDKVYLHPDESQTITINLHLIELTVVSHTGDRWLLHGMKQLVIGVDDVDEVKTIQVMYRGNSIIIEHAPTLW